MNIASHRIGRSAGSIRLWLLFAPLMLLLLPTNTAAAEPVSLRGAALANACATCHGPDGQSRGAIPSLIPLSKESLVIALRAFQTGERQGTVMNRIAKGLDDAEIEAVATYLGNLGKQ
jgi:cytochrome subunit of sulfide dehydrogenase